ncbi:MAG: hypothetical protein M4579_000239 [Chaenotheca gracillima]|nr:MAG: hypothetical protein M4579_000239 [Chaenotheca gracillima]
MADDRASPPPARPSAASNGHVSSPDAGIPSSRHLLTRAATIADMGLRDRRRKSSAAGDSPGATLDSVRNSSRDERRPSSLWPSAEELLQPKPDESSLGGISHERSNWHRVPLLIGVIPACAGIAFENGNMVMTDIILLALAALFLHWSVKLPWDWYHAARSLRRSITPLEVSPDQSDDDEDVAVPSAPLGTSEVASEKTPGEQSKARSSSPKGHPQSGHMTVGQNAAWQELRSHEVLALVSCFVFPVLGAYLLHAIRCQLSRPSEGLVSNFNLTIFLLAAEVRPAAHVLKMIQTRTLYLQRVVNEIPERASAPTHKIAGIEQRLVELETQLRLPGPAQSPSGAPGPVKVATLQSEQNSLRNDINAHTRTLQRHSRNANLQTAATDSRIRALQDQVEDALALATAAIDARKQQDEGPTWITKLFRWLKRIFEITLGYPLFFVALPFAAAWQVIRQLSAALASVASNRTGDSRSVAGKGAARERAARRRPSTKPLRGRPQTGF